MGNNIWTPDQQNAIEGGGGALLVSAAAGSGKTAVLVERVIQKIMAGADIDRFLIVTFTVAAAGEMRERISGAILKKLAETPQNRHLQRQSVLIHKAGICTIDSFCVDIVRSNFHLLDISPDFRIADNTEMKLMQQEILEEVFEYFYSDMGNNNFNLVAESFSTPKNDNRLFDIVFQIYESLGTNPYPERWLSDKLNLFNPENNDFEGNIWIKEIKGHVSSILKGYFSSYELILENLREDERLHEAFYSILRSEKEAIENALLKLQGDKFDPVAEDICSFYFAKLPTPKGYGDNPLKMRISSLRETFKKTVSNLSEGIFSMREADFLEDLKSLYPTIKALFGVVAKFREEMERAKKDKNILTFNDIEHLAFNLLVSNYDENTNSLDKTNIAADLSSQFDEIMVDEYQDINKLQDLIFFAISKDGENIFTVGDVKQSIYRFRKASPEIFLNKKNNAADYNEGFPARIILSKNFRSRNGVLDFANFIFSQIMSKDLGEMDYDEREMLYVGAEYPEKNEPCVEVDIIQLDKENSADTLFEEIPEDGQEADVDDLVKDQKEAKYIANKIKGMLNDGFEVFDSGKKQMRKAKLSDFCILLRSVKGRGETYVKELQNSGLNGFCENSMKYYDAYEVSLAIALLTAIDNPYSDIPLVSSMRSPVFAFTPDELAKIRLLNRKGKFYECVKTAGETGDEKCRGFLDKMNYYRRYARNMPVHKLIWHVYNDTYLFGIVGGMDKGEERQENLRQLYRLAKNYEQNGLKGLFGFISFINRVIEDEGDLNGDRPIPSGDSVKVMSIHKAKGLEFPIVILAATEVKFNLTDMNAPLLINDRLGVGPKLRDSEKRAEYTTFSREALKIAMKKEQLSEEMRVLYVALTRAKEKLIVVSAEKNLEKKLSRLALNIIDSNKINPYTLLSANGFSDWLLICLLRHKSCGELRRLAGAEFLANDGGKEVKLNIVTEAEGLKDVIFEIGKETQNKTREDKISLDDIKERLDFIYPHIALSKIPAKVSVSELKGRQNFDEDAEHLIKQAGHYKRPRFMEEEGLTGAEAGTALHKFMQFADFKNFKEGNIDLEIKRLVDKAFITKEEGECIDVNKVANFINSDIYKRLSASNNVIREYRFNIDIKAQEYDKRLKGLKDGDEKVMVQGVIDCFFEENGGFVLLDYKTDKILKGGEDILISRYAVQMDFYQKAIERLFKKSVAERIIYSFYLNEEIVI